MLAMFRSFGVMLMVLVPGGLLVLASFILARVLVERMKLEHGSNRRRLARAFATVRWPDVWRQTRAVIG